MEPIEPKKKRRIKVKVKPGQAAPKIPEGYERVPGKSKPGKDVYQRITTSKSSGSAKGYENFREPTAEEAESMRSGKYWTNPNPIQYQDDAQSKSKEEMVVKTKKSKEKEKNPYVYTDKEWRREQRKNRPQYTLGERLGSILPKIRIGKGDRGSTKCPKVR